MTLVAQTSRDRWLISLATALLGAATTAWMLLPGGNGFGARLGIAETTLFGFFEVTPFALVFKLIFLAVTILVLLASADYLRGMKNTAEYYALLLSATIGMMIVASGRDLITIFLGLETAAISTYVLAGYRKTDVASTEASMKIFIIGALSASLTLYGISLVYATAGTVDLYQLANFAATGGLEGPFLLAMALLVAGLGFEVTSVPFHMWAPDVYHGSPDTVSAFLASGTKKMGFAAFFKIFFVGLVAVKLQWDLLVGVLALLTMTVGNLVALQQKSLKRLLAWSSIAQAGYILLAFPVGTSLALTGAIFHILTHSVTTGGAFLILAAMSSRGRGDTIDAYRGLGRQHPLAAITLVLIMLSLTGIPPLAGFASKFVLFGAVVQAGLAEGSAWLLFLALAAVLNSAVSLVFYLRPIRAVYAEDVETGEPAPRLGVPASVTLVLGLVLAGTVFMGLWPQPFIDLSRIAADSLLGSVPSP